MTEEEAESSVIWRMKRGVRERTVTSRSCSPVSVDEVQHLWRHHVHHSDVGGGAAIALPPGGCVRRPRELLTGVHHARLSVAGVRVPLVLRLTLPRTRGPPRSPFIPTTKPLALSPVVSEAASGRTWRRRWSDSRIYYIRLIQEWLSPMERLQKVRPTTEGGRGGTL